MSGRVLHLNAGAAVNPPFSFFFLTSRDVPQPGTPLFTSHLERGPLRDLPKSLGAPSATTALVK